MRNAEPAEFRYEQIALGLMSQIEQGMLRPGDKAPSIRQICQRERVSPASAVQALSLLESLGLVEARPRSGFYIRTRLIDRAPRPAPIESTLEPAFVGVSDISARVFGDASDETVIPLGAAVPAPELLPNEKLSRCLAAAAREAPDRLSGYGNVMGHPSLVRQLALRFATYGCHISPDEIMVTVGTMEALNLAVRAIAGPGDIIAVESPCYFGMLELLQSFGLGVVSIPSTCEHGIDLNALGSAIERHDIKGLILAKNFSNPSGCSLSDENKRCLLALHSDYGIPLVEDDIYGDLHFGPIRPRPVKALDDEGMVLYCGSVSKTLSPGLGVGWVAAGKYAERVRRLKFISSLTTPTVTQLGLAKFLEMGAMDRHLRKLRRAIERQVAQTTELILESFPVGTAVSRPAGGCFLWVQLPDGVDSLDLHHFAVDRGISIVPGQLFSASADARKHVRISCGSPLTKRVSEAIGVLGEHVRFLANQNLEPRLSPRERIRSIS